MLIIYIDTLLATFLVFQLKKFHLTKDKPLLLCTNKN
jgi:hypothetical protein